MMIVGIDIGAKGCMCWTNDFRKFNFIDYDKNLWSYFLREHYFAIDKVMIELVHSMPRQGVKSMFTFGEKLGWIQGFLDALEVNYTMVKPQQWQKLLKVSSGSGKQGIYKRVKEVYPQVQKELIGSRGGLKDGRADSLGILHSYKFIKE